MADAPQTYLETLRLYEKACVAWAQAADPTILSWQFEREGREGEFDLVERDKLVEFIQKLITDNKLDPIGDPKAKDYWVKAREIIRSELARNEGTEFQAAQPDKEALEGLEKIAQDQAKRRQIPVSDARKLVWQVLRAQAKTVIDEATSRKETVAAVEAPLNVVQKEKAPTGESLTAENQQRLDREMKRLTESADRRQYNLRREPDKVLFEAIKGIFAQILRKVDSSEQIVTLIVPEEERKLNYEQPLDSPETTRAIRDSGGTGLAKQLAQKALSKITKKGLQSAAQRLGWTALETGVKTATTTLAKGAITKGLGGLAAAIFGGPVGWVIGAATLLKGAWDFLVKGGLGGFFKKLFPGLLSQGQIYAKQGIDATLGGGSAGIGMSLGAVIGAIMGAAGGPAGMLGLALIGGVIGRTAGSFLGGFFGGSITLEPGQGVDITGAGKKKKKGLLALLGSASIMAAGAWAVLILMVLMILFFLNQNKQQEEAAPIAFTVSVTANPTKIADFETQGRQATIQYTIEITAKVDDVELKGAKVNVKMSAKDGQSFQLLAPKDLVLSKTTLAANESLFIPFDFNIPGNYDPNIFDDSKVYGNVEIVGWQKDEADETRTASAVTIIGNPPFNQPYGYPAAGVIQSLDTKPGFCHVTFDDGREITQSPQLDANGNYYCATLLGVKKVRYNAHKGTILRLPFQPDNCRGTPLSLFWEIQRCGFVPGGMDISQAGGNVPVYSTIDGKVIKSVFDWGPTNVRGKDDSCSPILSEKVNGLFNRFCYPAVGGVVYIQSDDKKYIVAYLHLAKDELVAEGATVIRGQQIGKTYPGRICEQTKGLPDQCTSYNPHVHYQVFLDGFSVNINFEDVNVVGSCLDGKILPKTSDGQPLPVLGQYISQAVTECN